MPETIAELVIFLGCPDEPLFKRLSPFASLGDAWNEHQVPGDLAWLVARIANTWEERMRVATIGMRAIELAAPENAHVSATKELVERASERDGQESRNELLLAIAAPLEEARKDLLLVERKLRGRGADKTLESAVHSGISAAKLMIQGGWRGRSAIALRASFETLARLSTPESLCELLREIAFLEFHTSWWTANPSPIHGLTR